MTADPEPPTTVAAKVDLFRRAAAHGADYIMTERLAPVVSADPGAVAAIRDRLEGFSLDRPRSPESVIDTLAALGDEHAVRSTGGRYFGFVTGGTEAAAQAASVLAAAWDQNVALPAMSPLAATIDEVCVEWLLDLLGLPGDATASFCPGASVANLTAIITARDALLAATGWEVATRGLAGAPSLDVVVSDEIHVSVLKALRLAGIGTDSISAAPVDELGRIDPEQFPTINGPTLIVTQVGNVNTGQSDPVADIVRGLPDGTAIEVWDGGAPSASADGRPGPVWVHVDGAFGLWAAASPSRRHLVEGVAAAHSWATDCHKWLNVGYDCGLVAVADSRHLVASMTADAAYLGRPDAGRSLMHLGLQMSQAARAVPVWASLAAQGRNGVAALVDRCCDLAARFAEQLADRGATILTPVVLNQVLVSFGSDAETDAVVEAVARDGRAWMGGTTWQGRRAMRISVSDIATDAAAVDAAVSAVLDAWAEVDAPA